MLLNIIVDVDCTPEFREQADVVAYAKQLIDCAPRELDRSERAIVIAADWMKP